MTILVNGQTTQVSADETLQALFKRLKLPGDGVAVAVNLEVVPRAEHGATRLKQGDKIEFVRAVGGG